MLAGRVRGLYGTRLPLLPLPPSSSSSLSRPIAVSFVVPSMLSCWRRRAGGAAFKVFRAEPGARERTLALGAGGRDGCASMKRHVAPADRHRQFAPCTPLKCSVNKIMQQANGPRNGFASHGPSSELDDLLTFISLSGAGQSMNSPHGCSLRTPLVATSRAFVSW